MLRLRIRGLTFDAIGKELGVTRQAACKAYRVAMDALAAETRGTATQLRELELARLDELQAGIHNAALASDPAAVQAELKIMDRRARLMGLDARQTIDITTDGKPLSAMTADELRAEREALLAGLGRITPR